MSTQEPTPAPGEELSVALALVNTRVSGTRGVFDRLEPAGAIHSWLGRHRLSRPGTPTDDDTSGLIQLRRDARAVLEAVERRDHPDRAALQRVNGAAEPVRPVLSGQKEGLNLEWRPHAGEASRSRIARDLVMFATSPAGSRLRTCAADDCDRMFVQDHGRRIWCSPGCGNRMRVQRHAARARAARS